MKAILGKEEMFYQLKKAISNFVPSVDKEEILEVITIDDCTYSLEDVGGELRIEALRYEYGFYSYSIVSWNTEDFIKFITVYFRGFPDDEVFSKTIIVDKREEKEK